jgi:O-antigen/teichoic acid export membrane protein
MITGLIGPLSSTGVTWVLSANYYKQSEEDNKSLLFNIVLLDILLKIFWCLVFWIAAQSVLSIIVTDFKKEYLFYFMLALLGTLLNGIWPNLSYAMVLEKRSKQHAFVEITQYLAAVVTTILCLTVFHLRTETLFISPIMMGLTGGTLGLILMKDKVQLRISTKWFKEIFKVGMPTIPVNFIELITNTIDRYFIQKWVNLSQLGIYAHSKSYQNIFTMGTRAFRRSFVPEILDVLVKNKNMHNIGKILSVWYGLLGFAGLIVILFSYDIINFLTHGKFTAAAYIVPIWFFLQLSYAYGMLYSQYLFLCKKTAFLTYSGIIIGIVFIGIGALLIYFWGIMGAAISMVLSNFCIQLVRRIYAVKLGCRVVGEREFCCLLGLLGGVYLLNRLVWLSEIEKGLLGMILSLFIYYKYGINKILNENMNLFIKYKKTIS